MLGAVIFGLILPPDNASDHRQKEDTTWRYLFGFPAVLCVLSGLYLLIIIRMDTPKYYLMKETQEGDKLAEKVLSKIYKTESAEQLN